MTPPPPPRPAWKKLAWKKLEEDETGNGWQNAGDTGWKFLDVCGSWVGALSKVDSPLWLLLTSQPGSSRVGVLQGR